MNKFYLVFRFIALMIAGIASLLPVKAQLLINEYSCSNKSTIVDNFGDYEDWFEIYNQGAAAQNVTGYYLSDNPANPTKWQIPSGNIPSNGFLRIFASGRDQVAGAFYHTNFKLTQTSGEMILLSDPSGTIVDSLTIRLTQLNHSRARNPNGAAAWMVCTTPTPGASNGAGFIGYAVTPGMSLNPGFYGGPQVLALSTSDPNTVIRYTLDGSDPTATSNLYSGPININATTLVKARCYHSNAQILPGFIETNTYFINVSHTVPVVSVGSANYTNLFGNSMQEIVSSLEYFDVNGNFQFEAVGEVDPHGNDSWAYPQKGIDYIVRDEYGYDDAFDYQIFHTRTRQKFQRIILKAGASDNYPFGAGGNNPNSTTENCHIRDAFVQSLAQRAGMDVDLRASESCVMYINGQYWGVYEIREKVNDPDYTDYYHGQKKEDLDFLSYWGGLTIRYGTNTDWNNLYNYIMNNNLAIPANYAQVENRLKISNVIDYMIINTFSVNTDWINWNTMWWRGTNPPPTKWRYALWDMDNTFHLNQNFSGWTTTQYTADPCDLASQFQNTGPNMGHMDIFGKLMENDQFKTQFINRYSQMLGSYLDCNYAISFLDSMVNVIAPEMPAQIARWGGTMAEWQVNLDSLRHFIQQRCVYINQGIVDCYDVTGPYDIAVTVDPPLSGTVTWGTNVIPSYPDISTYFGNITTPLTATPNTGFNFLYWEIKNHNLGNDTLLTLINYPIDTTDTIIAHFEEIIRHDLLVNVYPPGSGNVAINGFTPLSLPYINNYANNAAINIDATANTNYHFVKFQKLHNTLNPSDTVPSIFFNIAHSDTILAIFAPDDWPNFVFLVQPEESGDIRFNNYPIFEYPYHDSVVPLALVNLEATPRELFEFSHWELVNHFLWPDTLTAEGSLTAEKNDTIVAHFKLKEVIDPVVFVPSSFSPNGDGRNDLFQVYHSSTVVSGEIFVYDRWGSLLYKTDNLNFQWDGKTGSSEISSGVYQYIFRYTNDKGISAEKRGTITVLR